MRNIAVVFVTVAALAAAPALAADLPEYAAPASPPPVDAGLGGSFYLRASLGLNSLWTQQHVETDGTTDNATAAGYGYSYGVGVGYETGNGLRADLTLDQISNDGLTDGIDTLSLRSTVALANAYYDFPLGGYGAGGFGAYVGAGLGGAYYQVSTTPANDALPGGTGWTAAAAAMAGVTYDMGNVVADVGYRAIYLPELSNGQSAGLPNHPYFLSQNIISEIRGTLRYRFN
jgi:hypothetical protein